MSLNSVATSTLLSGQLSSMQQLQSKIAELNGEIASGKVADVGLALGSRVSTLTDRQVESSDLGAFQQSNNNVLGRFQAMETALSSIAGVAQNVSQAAITAATSSTDAGKQSLIDAAKSGLNQLTSLLGTTYNGQYIFSGINPDKAPVQDYLADPAGAGRTAVQSSFAATFGFPPSDSRAQSITADQMQAYLNGPFAANFDSASWKTNFSSASTDPVTYSISPNQKLQEGVSANSDGVVKLYSALTAIVDSGTANLSSDAFSKLATSVASMAGAAASQVSTSQASNGLNEQQIQSTNDRMAQQKSSADAEIDKMVGVDLTEASTQLNQLTTQLQATYAVTARLQQFSILNYLT